MPGLLDWRVRFIVLPGVTFGLVLSFVAVALSISQFIIQLQNNVGTSINTKPIYDKDATHIDAPVFSFCGPQPFDQSFTKCFAYQSGLRPVETRLDNTTEEDIEAHKQQYKLEDCAKGDITKQIYFHTIYESDKGVASHCISFAKPVIPSSLGDGIARRLFLRLQYASTADFQVYTLRLWDTAEVRTPVQAAAVLKDDPTQLYAGKIINLPYSLSGTAMFLNWQPPIPGVIQDATSYDDPSKAGIKYGPIAVRAGISAIFEVEEEGTQSLSQDRPFYYFDAKLASLDPLVKYPNTDNSIMVTLAFRWNSDTTFYYQDVLAITPVGMAALLISTIAFMFLALADGTAMWVDYEEGTKKT